MQKTHTYSVEKWVGFNILSFEIGRVLSLGDFVIHGKGPPTKDLSDISSENSWRCNRPQRCNVLLVMHRRHEVVYKSVELSLLLMVSAFGYRLKTL